MKPPSRKRGIIAVVAAVTVLSAASLIYPIGAAFSEQVPMMGHDMRGHDQMPGMIPQMHQQMMRMHGEQSAGTGVTVPAMPGQDAFGAIQEIVRMLEADPGTDWSKIDLEALRQHLIDMNEVTLKADAVTKPVEGGLEIAVTGEGRTIAAIQRILSAHARELDQMNGWSAETASLPNGVLLTVTSSDPKEVQHIRGLGFVGLLVSGSHHQPHHFAMARGEFSH
jgi:hypothetical protein